MTHRSKAAAAALIMAAAIASEATYRHGATTSHRQRRGDVMSRRPTLPTRLLVNAFRTGDNAGWYYERSVVEEIHADRLAELRDDIGRSGIPEPIRLDFAERRVIDGHYRVLAALDLGLTRIPVADAYDGSRWWDVDGRYARRSAMRAAYRHKTRGRRR